MSNTLIETKMSRPRKVRKITCPPKMKGFKPFGLFHLESEKVQLSFEEYESIKLINYEMLSQEEAAERMEVSRPTLTRIYNKALKIIAIAMIEGKIIEIEGGNFELENDWFRCSTCYKLIEGKENHIQCTGCTKFSDNELECLNGPNCKL